MGAENACISTIHVCKKNTRSALDFGLTCGVFLEYRSHLKLSEFKVGRCIEHLKVDTGAH